MQKLPLFLVLGVQVWSGQCFLDPLDEFHNSSGLRKIMAGINDLAANVGKIGLKLFNSSKADGVVKVKEVHVQEVWEATTWTSVNEHEAKFHGNQGDSPSSKVEDHESRYHGQSKASESLSEHETQYHGSDDAHHTHNLKEHEARYHNNRREPCDNLNQHETKHHGRASSSDMGEHEKKYHRRFYNPPIADHELEFHGVRVNNSRSLEEHLARFHGRDNFNIEEEDKERVKFHEEQNHGEPRCPYKRMAKYVNKNIQWILWGSAALLTMVML